jgi:amino acid transporter
MGGAELAAQAIASIAPSAVIAFTAAAIFASAGNATWLSFVFATIVILAVGYLISQFAKRRASAGSLYNYAAVGLGPFGAYLTGVTLLIGCYGIASGSLSGATTYMITVLNQLGLPVSGTLASVVVTVILGSLAILFTIRGIRLSARISLVLELLSIAIILIVLVLAIVHVGPTGFDFSQFSFEGIEFSGVVFGMTLGILGFVGFSSADSLGREAKNPYKAIPRAIMWSAVFVGVLYIFAAYAQVALLGDDLATSASPLDDMATMVGLPAWFNPILNFGVAASFFAVVVAPLNVIGRIVYVMGKEGVAPRYLGQTHGTQLTPHRVLLTVGPLVIALTSVLYIIGVDGMDIVVWVDTFGTYGYMVAYAAVAVAAVVYFRRIGVKNWLVVPAAVVAVGAMIYVFITNVYPAPAFPFNLIFWLFVAVLALAIVWYVFLKAKRPAVIAAIGTTETDVLEGISG